MLGLKINHLNSIGDDNFVVDFYENTFNCQVGSWPLSYLEIHFTIEALKNNGWDLLDKKWLRN
jgi:hypothetical protein